MKIIHISDYFTLKLWYQEAFLAREEIKNWDNVYILTSNKNYPFTNYNETYKNILWERIMDTWESNEEWITIKRLKSIFEIPSSALVVFMWVLKTLRAIKPDVIICHDLIKPNNIWAYFYKIFFNKSVKIIIDTHEAEYNTSIDSILKKLYIALRKIFYRPIITKYSNKIVATWPNEKAFAQKYFLSKKTKIEIIPLWADTELFKPNKNIRWKMRNQYNIKDNEIIFVNAWKINESKKNMELLEAFWELHKSNKNLRLFFIWNWNQSYIKKMKEFVENNKLKNFVTFIPFVKNEELPNYFNMADVWVWPWSRSNVFREAASNWLPLILEDREYTRELVYEWENWYLLNIITKNLVCKALDKIIKMNIKKMWLKSREIIEKEFSRKIVNKIFFKD